VTGDLLLAIPDPSVVLLIGAAGAGKSTFAVGHFPADAIISSDALREAILGNATDQTANGRVFAAVHRALDQRLAADRLAVVDATNLTAAGRRAIRERAGRAGVPAVAIVFALPADLVRRRNAARPGRQVPDAAVARHLIALERILEQGVLEREGYQRIVRLDDPGAVERVTVRLSRGRARTAEP
jgi:predicted kinase